MCSGRAGRVRKHDREHRARQVAGLAATQNYGDSGSGAKSTIAPESLCRLGDVFPDACQVALARASWIFLAVGPASLVGRSLGRAKSSAFAQGSGLLRRQVTCRGSTYCLLPRQRGATRTAAPPIPVQRGVAEQSGSGRIRRGVRQDANRCALLGCLEESGPDHPITLDLELQRVGPFIGPPRGSSTAVVVSHASNRHAVRCSPSLGSCRVNSTRPLRARPTRAGRSLLEA
jgi:hypothetical protein